MNQDLPLPLEPSSDLKTLTRQLLVSLPNGATGLTLDGWLRYFDKIIALTTLAVAHGQLDVPGEQHARMHVFLRFIEDHHEGKGDAQKAAVALHGLIGMLEVQHHALRLPQMELILRDPTTLEHNVLSVLFNASPQQLDCAAIKAIMSPDANQPPVLEDISEVLEKFFNLGLIVNSGQAHPHRTHYRLWGTGRELCARIGLK